MKDVRQFSARSTEDEGSRTIQRNHTDTACDHAEDDNVEGNVNAARQPFLPQERSLHRLGLLIEEPPPDDAERGEQQGDDRCGDVHAQAFVSGASALPA